MLPVHSIQMGRFNLPFSVTCASLNSSADA